MNRLAILISVGALVPVSAAAQSAPGRTAMAPATPTIAAGATVYDTAGGIVGTIESTDGTNAVISTGTVKAAVAVTSLGAGAKGPVLAMTRAQLEAASTAQQAQASAAFKAQLVPGATVYGAAGDTLGTIKAADAQYVTMTTAKGDVKLPVGGFGPGAKGVTIGMTAAQLDAAMGGAAAASATAPAPATTPPAGQ